jgi:predicted nucleic acid-binding protein
MRIYLDTCCYNRPFDDQHQERVHIESEAILIIIKRAQQNLDEIIGSDVLNLEMSQIFDEDKKQKIKDLYEIAGTKVRYTEYIFERAQDIMLKSSIRAFDSLHIACAKKAKADVLLTTDDALEKASLRLELSISVMNPLKYLLEVI